MIKILEAGTIVKIQGLRVDIKAAVCASSENWEIIERLGRETDTSCDDCGPQNEGTFPTCEAVGNCPKPNTDAAPYHHFYWDADRDTDRMEAIHGHGAGHEDPMSEYTAVICRNCGLQALVHHDADDLPEI